ncbi:MAG: hypothetical protein ABR518_09675 [Actinomycetota bacterium]
MTPGADLPAGCAEVISLDAASERAPFALLVPHDELANESIVAEVRACATEVSVRFETGITLIMDKGAVADPESVFLAMAKENPSFQVGEVRGHVALLFDPAKDPNQSHGGLVEFVEGGVLVGITADRTITLSDLRGVAESLAPYTKGNDSSSRRTKSPRYPRYRLRFGR